MDVRCLPDRSIQSATLPICSRVNGTSTRTALRSPKISVDDTGKDTIGSPLGNRPARRTPSETKTS
jgi:hypothetical protein